MRSNERLSYKMPCKSEKGGRRTKRIEIVGAGVYQAHLCGIPAPCSDQGSYWSYLVCLSRNGLQLENSFL